MTSKIFSRSGAGSFDVSPSPETMYHFPMSPSEPGKFDFYRVHVANQTHHSDPVSSDNSDAPVLSISAASSSTSKTRWTPFADLVSDQSKSSILTSSLSSNSIPIPKSQTVSTVSSNTNGKHNDSIQSAFTLTDVVKNAMDKGELSTTHTEIRRPISGVTLSSKDLNHLSPQSM